MSGVTLGEKVPDFQCETTQGPIDFYKWAGNEWVLFLSHPHHFRPVCATEYGRLARMVPQFSAIGVKVLMLCVDPESTFEAWAADIQATQGTAVNFPVVIDTDATVARAYGMIQPEMNATAPMRCSFIISPDKRLRASAFLPASLGRNFDDLKRMCQSLQLTDRHSVATPANWQNGEDVIIVPGLSEEEASRKFPQGWDEQRPYLRVVRLPLEGVLAHPV